MPRRRRLVPLIAMLVALTASSVASADQGNAAVWYRRALDSMERRLTVDELEYIGNYASSPTVIPAPTPQLRSIVAKARLAIEFARRGSQQTHSDFELDYGQGLDLMLPHLSSMRTLERVMRADAMLRFADGDAAGGVDVLTSTVRIAGHLAEDRTLISSLVGSASFQHADGGIQWAIDHATLTPELGTKLLESVRSLDPGDPFGMADAVAMEQEVVVDWLVRRFEEDGGAAGLTEGLLGVGVEPADADRFADLDAEAFYQGIGQYDLVMGDIVEAFAIEDPELAQAVLEQIDAEVAAGEHGAIMAMFGGMYARVYAALRRSREAVAARARVLEELAREGADATKHANAAALYLEAIAELEALPHLDLLRAADTAPNPPAGADLLELLSRAQPVVALVRRASTTKRCDFTFARFVAWPTVAQPYAPGFRDLYRLLHVDARRLLGAPSPDEARDRIEIALRMTGHLSLDRTAASALVADHGFRRTLDLVEIALDDGSLPGSAKDHLADALRRVGRADAFGYIGAVDRLRQPMAATLKQLRPDVTGPAWATSPSALDAAIERWSEDRLVSMTVVLESLVRARPDLPPRHPEVDLTGLDVFPAAGLEAARERSEAVLDALARGVQPLDEVELPVVVEIGDRMREARAVLRRGAALLRAEPASGPTTGADKGASDAAKPAEPGG